MIQLNMSKPAIMMNFQLCNQALPVLPQAAKACTPEYNYEQNLNFQN